MASCSICDDSPDPALDCSRCGYKGHRNTPLVDDTCDACERRDNFGFHSEALARKVTSQLARGLAHPYYLVQSHTGLWYFVRAVRIDTSDLGRTFLHDLAVDSGVRKTIQYLGGKIVANYNSLGDEIEL